MVDGDGVGRGGDQADAGRDLRGERAGEDQHEHPESEHFHRQTTNGHPFRRDLERLGSGYSFSALVSAGTISNRSPTMP